MILFNIMVNNNPPKNAKDKKKNRASASIYLSKVAIAKLVIPENNIKNEVLAVAVLGCNPSPA